MPKMDNMLKRTDPKSFVLLLAVLGAFLIGFSDFLTGDVVKTNSFYIDKGDYTSGFGDSQCTRFDGLVFSVGKEKIINGNVVELLSLSDDVVSVSVNGEKRGIKSGHEKYINGLFVTFFAAGSENACLIVN